MVRRRPNPPGAIAASRSHPLPPPSHGNQTDGTNEESYTNDESYTASSRSDSSQGTVDTQDLLFFERWNREINGMRERLDHKLHNFLETSQNEMDMLSAAVTGIVSKKALKGAASTALQVGVGPKVAPKRKQQQQQQQQPQGQQHNNQSSSGSSSGKAYEIPVSPIYAQDRLSGSGSGSVSGSTNLVTKAMTSRQKQKQKRTSQQQQQQQQQQPPASVMAVEASSSFASSPHHAFSVASSKASKASDKTEPANNLTIRRAQRLRRLRKRLQAVSEEQEDTAEVVAAAKTDNKQSNSSESAEEDDDHFDDDNVPTVLHAVREETTEGNTPATKGGAVGNTTENTVTKINTTLGESSSDDDDVGVTPRPASSSCQQNEVIAVSQTFSSSAIGDDVKLAPSSSLSEKNKAKKKGAETERLRRTLNESMRTIMIPENNRPSIIQNLRIKNRRSVLQKNRKKNSSSNSEDTTEILAKVLEKVPAVKRKKRKKTTPTKVKDDDISDTVSVARSERERVETMVKAVSKKKITPPTDDKDENSSDAISVARSEREREESMVQAELDRQESILQARRRRNFFFPSPTNNEETIVTTSDESDSKSIFLEDAEEEDETTDRDQSTIEDDKPAMAAENVTLQEKPLPNHTRKHAGRPSPIVTHDEDLLIHPSRSNALSPVVETVESPPSESSNHSDISTARNAATTTRAARDSTADNLSRPVRSASPKAPFKQTTTVPKQQRRKEPSPSSSSSDPLLHRLRRNFLATDRLRDMPSSEDVLAEADHKRPDAPETKQRKALSPAITGNRHKAPTVATGNKEMSQVNIAKHVAKSDASKSTSVGAPTSVQNDTCSKVVKPSSLPKSPGGSSSSGTTSSDERASMGDWSSKVVVPAPSSACHSAASSSKAVLVTQQSQAPSKSTVDDPSRSSVTTNLHLQCEDEDVEPVLDDWDEASSSIARKQQARLLLDIGDVQSTVSRHSKESRTVSTLSSSRFHPRQKPKPIVSPEIKRQKSTSQRSHELVPHQEEKKEEDVVIRLEHVNNKKIVDPYGDYGTYTGVLIRGVPDSYGVMKYEDGRVYTGSWKCGRWNGHGKTIFTNGDCYTGEYLDDQRHGIGRYEWADGRTYDGKFEADHREGSGIYSWPDGSVYNGDFHKGLRHGDGTYTFVDGSVYNGEWKNGKQTGIGECVWKDGRCYRGEWVDGQAHGYGIEVRADGTIRFDGTWKRDRPIRHKSKDRVEQQVKRSSVMQQTKTKAPKAIREKTSSSSKSTSKRPQE